MITTLYYALHGAGRIYRRGTVQRMTLPTGEGVTPGNREKPQQGMLRQLVRRYTTTHPPYAGRRGRLSADTILAAPSTPVHTPSYPRGPYQFFDREYFIIPFETTPEAIKWGRYPTGILLLSRLFFLHLRAWAVATEICVYRYRPSFWTCVCGMCALQARPAPAAGSRPRKHSSGGCSRMFLRVTLPSPRYIICFYWSGANSCGAVSGLSCLDVCACMPLAASIVFLFACPGSLFCVSLSPNSTSGLTCRTPLASGTLLPLVIWQCVCVSRCLSCVLPQVLRREWCGHSLHCSQRRACELHRPNVSHSGCRRAGSRGLSVQCNSLFVLLRMQVPE